MMKGLGGMLKQAQKLQETVKQAQEAVKKLTVTGESGAGFIKVRMNGEHDILKVEIDDTVLKEDKSILEDLLGAAVNDANRKLERKIKQKMDEATGGMDLPAGIKFPF